MEFKPAEYRGKVNPITGKLETNEVGDLIVEVVPNCIVVEINKDELEGLNIPCCYKLTFDIKEGYPKLPLKHYGFLHRHYYYNYYKTYSLGWVVDSDNQTWIERPSDGNFEKRSHDELIFSTEFEEDEIEICKAIGRKPPQPSWYKKAIEEGWAPPLGVVVDEKDI